MLRALETIILSFLLVFSLHVIADNNDNDGNNETDPSKGIWRPKVGEPFQIVLSSVLEPNMTRGSVQPPHVHIFDVDLFDTPKETIVNLKKMGKKVICYFSAGTSEDWREDYGLFKSEMQGANLPMWPGERWLDVRQPEIFEIMKKRMKLAQEKGCDAVDPDNMDGYDNEKGGGFKPPLVARDTIKYMRQLSKFSHGLGMSIGLKNSLQVLSAVAGDIEFAVNEECGEESEACQPYANFLSPGSSTSATSTLSWLGLLNPLMSRPLESQPGTGTGKPVFHIEYVQRVPVYEETAHRPAGSASTGAPFIPGSTGAPTIPGSGARPEGIFGLRPGLFGGLFNGLGDLFGRRGGRKSGLKAFLELQNALDVEYNGLTLPEVMAATSQSTTSTSTPESSTPESSATALASLLSQLSNTATTTASPTRTPVPTLSATTDKMPILPKPPKISIGNGTATATGAITGTGTSRNGTKPTRVPIRYDITLSGPLAKFAGSLSAETIRSVLCVHKKPNLSSKMSTVIKVMTLDGWVMFCDGKEYETTSKPLGRKIINSPKLGGGPKKNRRWVSPMGIESDSIYRRILAEPMDEFDAEADRELEKELDQELNGHDIQPVRKGSAKERRGIAMYAAMYGDL